MTRSGPLISPLVCLRAAQMAGCCPLALAERLADCISYPLPQLPTRFLTLPRKRGAYERLMACEQHLAGPWQSDQRAARDSVRVMTVQRVQG